MTTRVAARDLRNDTAGVIRKAEAGEEVIITVNGRDVARLLPIEPRPGSLPTEWFFRDFTQADPGLRDQLRELLPDTTDDLPWP